MTPYFQDEFCTLYHGPMEEVIPLIRPDVDAIVTDPPYEETSLDWDVWPTGWPALLLPFARQMWCFGSLRMFVEHWSELADWKFAQDVVWEKHNGSGLHNDRFRRVHELALHFYQGDWESLFKSPPVISVPEERKRRKLIRGKKPAHWGDAELGQGYDYNGRRLQRSVIPVASCHGYAVNETQKPEGIVAPLLKYVCPTGGTVLDPFAGSGTVLAVARAHGIKAIGIEKRESQCAEIKRRLAQKDLQLH